LSTARPLPFCAAGAAFVLALPAAAALGPVRAASPGEETRALPVAGACPTFSWGAVAGASGYLLVVAETDEEGAMREVALRHRLDGGELASWTPGLGECLQPGKNYSWSVGALAPGAAAVADAAWSPPRRFAIAFAPAQEELSAALDVLSRARGARGAAPLPALPAAPPAPRERGARGGGRGAAPATPPAVAAIRGEAAAAGAAGVVGVATATSGLGHGVYGETLSVDYQAAGVLGRAWTYGGDGVRGESTGTDGGNGLHGTAVGTWGHGVVGETAGTGGSGVEGHNSSLTGSGRGVYGTSAATQGYGAVSGWATASSGSNPGVRGDTSSPNGSGLVGVAFNTAGVGGTGVQGEAQTSTGKGVYGRATTTNGATYGVWGDVSSTAGTAVYGIARATSGSNYAIYGDTDSTQGTGVYGTAPNVAGAYAGYFSGRVTVTGTLAKGGGSFKIDHPLDPEHKYLYHSFVESPDMMNVYNGNVTLDEKGSAWIELPDWFEALNRDFRYQLTPLGQPSAVWIGHRVAHNRFEVRGAPGVEVSWQVTGIRHDRWADANRIPVEEVKPAGEQGTYLHPDAWGVASARGLEARRASAPPPPPPVAPLTEAPDAPR